MNNHISEKPFLMRCIAPIFFSFVSAFSLLPGLSFAQPDIQTARMLFEAWPIPETEAEALPLVSFNIPDQPAPVAAGEQGLAPGERRSIEESIQAYIVAVGDEESEEGPYSTTLTEDLLSAGLLAQQISDYERALDFFNRAQSVSRINDGLENLDQVRIMQAMVESYMALEQPKEADKIQENILYLARQAYGEDGIGTIPAMLDYGIWNMDAFLERSNILLNVPRMNVVQFMNEPMNFIDGGSNLRDTPLFNLFQAQQTFLQSINILVTNKEYFHPRILELENMLQKTYFLSIHRENILYEPDFYLTRKKSKTGSRLNTNSIELMESEEYKMGNASHERSIAYISNNPERTNTMVANAMLEAADWHLLFERKVKASRDYQAIYDLFTENPALEADVAELLYPEFPVILPTYLPPPNSREKLDIAPDEEVSYFGYFDVSFRIDKYGKAKRVRFLSEGGEVTRNMEIRLNQYLQNVLFRPLFRDGKPYTDAISVRYYIAI